VPSNVGNEEAASGTTPSANESGPSPNGSHHNPDTPAASSTPPMTSTAGEDGSSSKPPQTAREFFWERNQAARNTTAGWETPTSSPTPPFQSRPPTPQTHAPKGNPTQ
jgi:hypothetical protein